MMDLAALKIFQAVVEQGGVGRAATKLHRVPSNVTTRMKQLEAQLGTRLFVRDGRKLALSNEGKLLLPYANQLLRLSEEAEAAMKNGKPRGALRIGSLESTAAARLPSLLSSYHKLYPEVQIEMLTGTSGALVQLLHKQVIEAAFVAEPFDDEGLETHEAFREELVLIAPRSRGKIRGPKDIHKSTLIAFASGCSYRKRLEAWLGDPATRSGRIIELQSYHAIVACVAAGTGIAIVPRSVIEMSVGRGNVTVTPLPPRFSRATTRLAWRARYHSLALEALKRQLQA